MEWEDEGARRSTSPARSRPRAMATTSPRSKPDFCATSPRVRAPSKQRVDLDHGGSQAGPIGVSAAGGLASEDELLPIMGIDQPARNTASPRRPGPER